MNVFFLWQKMCMVCVHPSVWSVTKTETGIRNESSAPFHRFVLLFILDVFTACKKVTLVESVFSCHVGSWVILQTLSHPVGPCKNLSFFSLSVGKSLLVDPVSSLLSHLCLCLQLPNEEEPGEASQVAADAPPPYSSIASDNAGRAVLTSHTSLHPFTL